MKQADINEGLLMDLNDSGYTFDEISDYLDRVELQVAVAVMVGIIFSETMVVIV
jgi:hypothetical protein